MAPKTNKTGGMNQADNDAAAYIAMPFSGGATSISNKLKLGTVTSHLTSAASFVNENVSSLNNSK